MGPLHIIKSALAGVALLLAMPVNAAIVTWTFTGTNHGGNFDDETDWLGLFGAPGALLDGRAFKLVYRMDTTFGLATSYADPSSIGTGHTYIRPNFSDPNDPHDALHTPAITSVLTIDGHSYSFDGRFSPLNDYISTQSSAVSTLLGYGSFTDLTLNTRQGPDLNSTNSLLARSFDNVIPLGYTQSYSIDLTQPRFYTNGRFDICPNSTASRFQCSSSGLKATLLVVDAGGGGGIGGSVPEPSSWAMLSIGFGVVGTAARRRRVKSPVRPVLRAALAPAVR